MTTSRRRWRWLWWLCGALLALRLALAMLLPWLANLALAGIGLSLHLRDWSLSLLALDLDLRGVTVRAAADGRELLHCHDLRIDVSVAALCRGELAIARLEGDGMRLQAELLADGSYELPLLAAIGAAGTAAAAAPPPPESADPAATPAPLNLPLRVDDLRLQDLRVQLSDRTQRMPAVELLSTLVARGLGGRAFQLAWHTSAHGLFDLLELRLDGSAGARSIAGDLRLALRGVKTEAACGWLQTFGIAPDSREIDAELNVAAGAHRGDSGALAIRLDADLTTQVDGRPDDRIGRFALRSPAPGDGPRAIELQASDLQFDLLHQQAELRLLGVRVLAADDAPDPAAPDPAAGPATPLRLDVDFENCTMRYGTGDPAQPLALEAKLHHCLVRDLRLGGQLHLGSAAIALQLPEVAETLLLHAGTDASGRLIDAAVEAHGVTMRRLAPQLADAGIAADWQGAELRAALQVTLPAPDHPGYDLQLRDLLLQDRDRRFELASVQVSGFELDAAARLLSVRDVQVMGPTLTIQRDQQGRHGLVGLTTVPTQATAAPAPAPEPAEPAAPWNVRIHRAQWRGARATWENPNGQNQAVLVTGIELDVADVAVGPALAREKPASVTFRAQLPELVDELGAAGEIDLDRGAGTAALQFKLSGMHGPRLRTLLPEEWLDRLVNGNLDAALTVSLDEQMHVDVARLSLRNGDETWLASERLRIRNLPLRQPAPPIELDLVAQLFDGLEVRIDGELVAAPQWRATADIAIDHLERGIWPEVLPAGLHSDFSAGGSLALRVAAEGGPHPDGGSSVKAELSALALRDGERTLLEVPRALVQIDRADPQQGLLHVGELSGELTSLLIHRDEAGLHALGLRQQGAAGAAVPAVPAGDAPPPARAWTELDFALRQLDWRFRGVHYTCAHPEHAIAELQPELHLRNAAPIHLRPGHCDPVAIVLSGSAAPHIAQLAIETKLDLSRGLVVEQRLDLAGVDLGGALTADAPRNGELHGTWRAEVHRRGQVTMLPDLQQPFQFTFHAKDLALREGKDGRLLLGCRELDVRAPLVHLPGRRVQIERIEIDTPIGHLRRTAQGLDLSGLRLAGAPAAAAAAGEPAAPPPADPAPAPVPAEPPPPAPSATDAVPWQVEVGRVLASGLEVSYQDDTTTPSTLLPLQGLEAQVDGLRLPLQGSERPLRYRIAVAGGEVRLPVIERSSSLLTGVLSSTSALVTGGAETRYSQRAWFDEIVVQGETTPDFRTGKAHLSLNGLDLLALRGLAALGKVDIGDGTLDAGVQLDARGDAGYELRNRFVFTNLSLAEPPGGPISTYLKLPAALDTVLFLLRNSSGEHRISIDLRGEQQGLDTRGLTAKAIAAFGDLVAKAIADSPFRVVGSLTSIFGLGGGPEDLSGLAGTAEFAGGAMRLSPEGRTALEAAMDAMRGDPELFLIVDHELGTDDLAVVERRLRPAPELCQDLVQRLRSEHLQLQRLRTAAFLELQYRTAAGLPPEETGKHLDQCEQRLQAKGRELAAMMEMAADDQHEWQVRRREALRELAAARLELLHDWLGAQLPIRTAAQVEVRPARLRQREEPAGRVSFRVVRRAR